MDLGLLGKTALVCASSKGLGRACAFSLAREGVNLFVTARGEEALEATAHEIRQATGVKVTAVVCDITSEDGRRRVLEACPQPDILVTNAAGPPHGDFRDWSRETWIAAIDASMLSPIEMIRLTVDGMIARRFGRIINITSITVKAAEETLGLSNAARSGLTGFVAGLARKTVAHNVTINNLLPASIDTDRLKSTIGVLARNSGVTPEQMRRERVANAPAGRFGDPREFGDACAYLCSAQAGYITGLNLLLDGGRYPGTF